MLDVYLIIDLVIIVSLAILALAVVVQRKLSELSLTFAALAVSVAVWIIANYISNDISLSPQTALTANYFVFFFSFFTAVHLLHFTISLARDVAARKWLKRLYPAIILVGLMSFTPLVPSGVQLQDNVYAVEFGEGLPVYFVFLIGTITSVFLVLSRNIKRLEGVARTRLIVIRRSFSVSLPALALMLFILPVATGWFGLTNIGIIPMAALVAGLYYAVFKHQLFDLRRVVIRSLAYGFTLATILVIYAFISYETSAYLFEGQGQSWLKTIFNAVLVIVAAVSYGPIKSRFNRLSDRLFFRDAYDAEELFSRLNTMLVSSLDVNYLMSNSVEIIKAAIKPNYAVVGIRDKISDHRIFGEAAIEFSQRDIDTVQQLTPNFGNQKVIVADSIDESEHRELKAILNRYSIGVLVRLTQNAQSGDDGIGYLVLGYKKGGNAYTAQDIRVLNTVGNELTIAAQNALQYEEIQRFNIELQERVEKATKKLSRANEKLIALDETKDEFISMASHQLRTPLTSVKGYLSMVLEGDAGEVNPMQKKLLEQSFTSSQRMVYLISDLLNLSRLRTGKFVIENNPTNLATVINGELDQLREAMASKNMSMVYKEPKNFPTLMLDETKIRQVLMNFIDNAIYYTPANGKIEVSLKDTGKMVEFRVKDNGIGVPKSEQHHLFNKFYRAGNARKMRPDGTGLGLFMAKKVIVAQGGALLFESQEGKGSTFGFVFNKAKMLAPQDKK